MSSGVIMLKKIIILYFYLKTKYFNLFHSENLSDWQDKKVRKFLKKILPKSKYYARKYEKSDINEWKNFPTIDKKELMDNFDELNTVSVSKENAFKTAYKAEKERNFAPKINSVTVGLSSGTSGNRGIFLASDIERYKWAGAVLAKILPKSIFCKHRIAFFLRANSNLYEAVKSRNIKFCYFDMLNELEFNLKKLNNFNPTLLVAPPSMLKLIAKNFERINIKPEKIIAVAEVLDDIDKIYLEKIFKLTIHQVYQATEGFIATTCKYGHLHINEDILVIQKEYIDKENNKFIPVITDFNRTSEPIIRYKLNDILTENKEPCPCGSKYLRIEKIEGRCDDIFYFKSKKSDKTVPVFPDFLSRAIIFASNEINEYKVIQISLNEIQVYIDNVDKFDDIKNSLINIINKFDVILPKITLLHQIEIDNSKKFKRIESKLSKEYKNEICS